MTTEGETLRKIAGEILDLLRNAQDQVEQALERAFEHGADPEKFKMAVQFYEAQEEARWRRIYEAEEEERKMQEGKHNGIVTIPTDGKFVPKVTEEQLALMKAEGWVQVIRCKDCKWYGHCNLPFSGDEFCSDGERKEEQ